MEFLKDLWGYLRTHKKLWLTPIIVLLILLGVLMVLAQSSVIGPFIYTLW